MGGREGTERSRQNGKGLFSATDIEEKKEEEKVMAGGMVVGALVAAGLVAWGVSRLFSSESSGNRKVMKAPGRNDYILRDDFESDPKTLMEFRVERKIKHYSSNHKILLVGEGDFSFSKCLANAFGSASNITATCLDSEASLMLKYRGARANIQELQVLGCSILHGVDASIMKIDPRLNFCTFDRIVFNFPHCGIFKEKEPSVIELNKGVVRGFLRNAIDMLATNGEVHITHKTEDPFMRWEIEVLAQEIGFCLLEKSSFYTREYAGYVNKRGAGFKCDESFPAGQSATFKFVKAHQSVFCYL